jgi:DNA-binding response OmpR family regulator
MAKLLIVEDDQMLASELVDELKRKSYYVDHASTGGDARNYFKLVQYDLVVLDWELPDCSGPELCRELRKQAKLQIPVLFLTGRSAVSDKLVGFDSGADDYLTKPFNMQELLARVKALLNRPPVVQSKVLVVRDISLDAEKHEVFKNGVKVELYPKEFELLEFFMSHPGQIFSVDALLARIWPTDSESSEDTVRVTLMRIRKKLAEEQTRPLILTLRNLGYRLDP